MKMNKKKDADMGVSTPLKENITLNFAMAYSQQLNYTIFPIHYKSKIPITKHGFHDASSDIEQIKEWFNKYPYAGIGLPTGKVNNVVAIDIDPRNGGMVSFERLVDEYAPFPHTVESLTGGNGLHKLFKYDERINKSSLKNYSGLDIQSDGKYIVLPPSTHPNGKLYHWEDASKPVITEMAELPSWFIDLATDRHTNGKHKARPVSDYIRLLQGVDEGGRNEALMTLIGKLINKLDYREVHEIAQMWGESRCNPPLEPNVITKAVNNILKREAVKR